MLIPAGRAQKAHGKDQPHQAEGGRLPDRTDDKFAGGKPATKRPDLVDRLVQDETRGPPGDELEVEVVPVVELDCRVTAEVTDEEEKEESESEAPGSD